MITRLRLPANELGLAGLGIAPATDEVREEYPWAKSVVVGAICYLPPDCEPEDDEPRGWVARVARSSDYHVVLRDKLERVAEVILGEYPGSRCEVCVDTCPLPERKLAVLAGIAWPGKNGNVFVDGCGSYAALGEVVTDIELPASEHVQEEQCGDCRACIRACPTGAISEDGLFDAGRCLSRVTQSSGIIPRELRPLMGARIYGCDTCQEACPRNIGVEPSAPEFAVDTWPGACPELIPLIDLSAEEFKRTVKNSSVGWIRRTRIRRNAAIAAGNLKCEAATPSLVGMLDDENPVLRAHAAWALGEIDSEKAREALRRAKALEQGARVLEEIEAALSK
jgi:epoxyqueuosine reductase